MSAAAFFAAHTAETSMIAALSDGEIDAAAGTLRALIAREREALGALVVTRSGTPEDIAAKCDVLASILRRETFEEEQLALAQSIAADIAVDVAANEMHRAA